MTEDERAEAAASATLVAPAPKAVTGGATPVDLDPDPVGPDPDSVGSDPVGRPVERTSVTMGEVALLVAVVAVAAIATVSLGLAETGRHDGLLAVVLGLVLTACLAAAGAALGGRVDVRFDRSELALVAVTGLAAAFFFFPGFPYASADKDPGIYVAHGFAIGNWGDSVIDDEAVQRGLDRSSLPGVWPPDGGAPGEATSQFYRLTSALLGTADDIAGPRGLFNLTPLLGVLSTAIFAVTVRRVAGTTTAWIATALLVTSMMQVWQAKYPSSEIPAQLYLMGALLGTVLAIDRGWAGGAFAAGLMIGTGLLGRPDGFLYLLVAAGLVAFGFAIGRLDRRIAVAVAAGVALSLPFALWNAYEISGDYSSGNGVPGLPLIVAACVGLLGLGAVARAALALIRRRSPDGATAAWASAERARPLLAVAGWLAAGALLLGFWYRPVLLGDQYRMTAFSDEPLRTLNELNLQWLTGYLTSPGIVVMWFGLLCLLATRYKPALYVMLLPGLMVLPLYLWDSRVSARLMWWVRRYVPAVLPAVLVLMALALAWLIARQSRPLRALGVAGAVALVVTYAAQSVPLRDHREMGGSWEFAEAISTTAGDEQGVFLFTEYTDIFDPMRNSPAVVWWVFDEVVGRLPAGYGLAAVEEYQDAFPGQPVFVVAQGAELPAQLPADRFELAREVVGTIEFWEESVDERPDEAIEQTRGVSLWELVA